MSIVPKVKNSSAQSLSDTPPSDRSLSDKSLSDKSLKEPDPSSLFGSISLVAGTTIGAGILALPAATLPSGLIPSSLLMIAAWVYMVVSGLLIAEANIYARQALGGADVGFLATIQYLLGKGGAIAAGIAYIFIHYALLVAYTARGGDILATAIGQATAFLGSSTVITAWEGHLLFSVLFGGLLLWKSEQFIAQFNSLLLAIVIAAFGGLLVLTIPQIQPYQLLSQHWKAVGGAIPVMFIAFVYQSVVPVVITQQQGNRSLVKKSIILGALVPLVMFLFWNGVILGSIDWRDVQQTSSAVIDPIEILRLGKSHPQLGVAVSLFSEFAVATSFIGFVYGLVSVFQDLFGPTLPTHSDNKRSKRSAMYALIILPPLALSLLSPTIFFDAIDASGALGTSLLFGIIPAIMVWKLRYQQRPQETITPSKPWVPGGKTTLIAMGVIAMGVIVQYTLLKTNIL